jgi:hypothetical protein
MSIGLLAAILAVLLVTTVGVAIWRCDHPCRMRYWRCARQRARLGIYRHIDGHMHRHMYRHSPHP